MAAVVQRLVTSPTIKTQHLAESGEWVDDARQAQEFSSYEAADAHAQLLRGQGEEHVHAAVKEKPMAHRPVIDPLAPPPPLIAPPRKTKAVKATSSVRQSQRLWWKEHDAYS